MSKATGGTEQSPEDPQFPGERTASLWDLLDGVDRQFFLLGQYRGLLAMRGRARDPERDGAITRLRKVLRKWFPSALRSGDTFLRSCFERVGNKDKSRRLLQPADIAVQRDRCLLEVAESAIGQCKHEDQVLAAFQDAAKQWRLYLPKVYERPIGHRWIERGDTLQHHLRWDTPEDMKRFRSVRGASFALAASCDRLAIACRTLDPKANTIPASRLSHSLREFPVWIHEPSGRDVILVDQQTELLRDVEVMARDFRVAIAARDVRTADSDPTSADPPASRAKPGVSVGPPTPEPEPPFELLRRLPAPGEDPVRRQALLRRAGVMNTVGCETTLDRYLRKLKDVGLAEAPTRGKWRQTPAGRTALAEVSAR